MVPNDKRTPVGEQAWAVVATSNEQFRKHLLRTLPASGWLAEEARGGAEALAKLELREYKAVFLDRWLPDLDVNELAGMMKARYPDVEVLMMDSEDRAFWTGEGFPEAFGRHAASRPLPASGKGDGEVHRQWRALVRPAPRSQPIPREEPLPGMIGASDAMQRVYRLARLVVPRSTTVLITGETGTGKELVARALHNLGPRARQPFVVVNCAAIPEALLEAELFGYTCGAFTGAVQSRLGRIHSAHGGTLLLDEVGELPPSMQAKLLRFLQDGEVQRLGSSDVFRVDVRVIACTNADLTRRLREERFRQDLFYRLAAFTIDLEPLRNRREDILPLATHYLDRLCRDVGSAGKSLRPEATLLIQAYDWPGNVRELQHVVERAFILAEDRRELGVEFFDLGSRES